MVHTFCCWAPGMLRAVGTLCQLDGPDFMLYWIQMPSGWKWKMKNKQFGYSFGVSVIFSSFSSFKLLCQKKENKWKGSSNCVWRHRPIWFPGKILRQALHDGRLVERKMKERKKMCWRGLIEVEEFMCSLAVSYFGGLQPRNYFCCRIFGRCSVLRTGELLIVAHTTIRTILCKFLQVLC